jgi:hypothetical protein
MPSSQSVARTVTGLTRTSQSVARTVTGLTRTSQTAARTVTGLTRRRPRLAIGAGAAGAAVASLIGVAAATTGPAISLAAAHGPAEASAGAISPALRVTTSSTRPLSGGSTAAASPQMASAPVQQAQSGGSAHAASSQVTSTAARQDQSSGSAAAASPQVASAPAEQLAQSSGSAAAASPQVASAPAEQLAQSGGSLPAASPQVAAAPAEQQAAAVTSPSSGSAALARHAAGPDRTGSTGQQPAAAPSAQPSQSAAPSQPAAAPAPQPAPQPYQFYDSVTPSAIPASSQAIAVYANGNYAASPSQLGHRGLVLWIDTNGSDPNADVLDVEPGDATPAQAATWVAQKLDASPNSVAIVYTMESEWPAVQAAINALPWWMPSHTRYWIADPTGVPHVVPGSQATQWYWGQNYDISTALPNF